MIYIVHNKIVAEVYVYMNGMDMLLMNIMVAVL